MYKVGVLMKILKNIHSTFKDMDRVIFILSLLLIIFGTLNIVTASSREAVVNANVNLFYYFYKHAIILFISFIAFIIVLNFKTKNYRKIMPIIYITVFGLNLYLILNNNRSI